MSAIAASSLSVSIKELPAFHVACVSYRARDGQGDTRQEIGECFRRLQSWVRRLEYAPDALLTIGVPDVEDGRLSSYACCIGVPEHVQNGSDGIEIQALRGGRYAVLTMAKDQQVIGDSIRRFYQEYVPEHNIEIDAPRPTYEIYYEHIMEYCVPVQSQAGKP
jgi:DNA gyrase inhibitor GyrI